MEAEKEDEEDASPEEFVALSDFSGSGSEQLSFSSGDKLLVHAKPSAAWWWAEVRGVIGYVPASYLRQDTAEEEDTSIEDPWQDEEYFGSYGTLNHERHQELNSLQHGEAADVSDLVKVVDSNLHLGQKLHLEMLSDRSRTETYRQVVLRNSASLKNKAVMDLGCGTGIISLFCAQLAQPSVVYAVEASSMAEYTKQLVKQNGCEEVVTVLQGRAEELELPEQVDVLVSEWMGNCLLFEFMVESVLLARDRWLRDGGVMWPSAAALTLVPCRADRYYAEKMSFWERPYGLDFTPLQPLAQQEFFTKPKFSHHLEPEDCLAVSCDVICLDMHTLQVSDLEEMKGEFHFCMEKSGIFHGFTAWFTVQFESLEMGGATVKLNTGPDSEPTHWKQTLFMLDRPVSVNVGDILSGTVTLHRNPVWRRHMTVALHWNINNSKSDADSCQVGTKSFPMWR